MRSILLSKTDEAYLQKCATEHAFTYGIIIGQHAEADKDVVVHLAKNGEEEMKLAAVPDEHVATGAQEVADIDTQALANQWISASKMIPGSFEVLGIFVASTKDSDATEKTFGTAKKLLYDVHNLLTQCHNFSPIIDELKRSDILFLVYSSTSRNVICKSYTHSNNGGSFTPAECRFVEKPFEWYSFECSYELDDIFPIVDTTQKINIEDQFQKSIETVRNNLQASEVFIQNETIDESLRLEAYIRLKHGKKDKPEGAIRATIYLPLRCQTSGTQPIKVKEFNGTIRFSGVISSRIWCNPRNSIGDVKRFVRDDILRSLVARIQVYCDGLTATNVSNETIFISEPPRRIYFNLHTPSGPSANGGCMAAIQFSEYIFRGEAPTVAVAQAKQILDLDINIESICADLEGLPDDDLFNESSSDVQSLGSFDTPIAAHDLTRTMYMLGITVSLLVLFISILLHFIFRQT